MSGGDLDYSYFRVEESAREIREKFLEYFDDARKHALLKFCDHLELVSKALHDVELVLSGEYGSDGADEAIDAVLMSDKDLMLKWSWAKLRDVSFASRKDTAMKGKLKKAVEGA